MTDKNRNLLLRIVSAVVLLPIVLSLLHRGGVWSGVLMAVPAAICVCEYYLIVFKHLSPATGLAIAAAIVMPMLPVLWPDRVGWFSLWIIGSVFLLAWTYHLIRSPLADAPAQVGQVVTGFLYGAFGMTLLSVLRQGSSGLMWTYCALIVTWGNDTLAYFAGRLFGRHKLYPAVSPNKTWEGFAGGMVGSIAGLFIARTVVFGALTPLDCLVLGLGGAVLGPIGDLCESMLKRAYQVKDSGKTIPGHGGMLDRVDALLFNAPWVLLYVSFLRPGL